MGKQAHTHGTHVEESVLSFFHMGPGDQLAASTEPSPQFSSSSFLNIIFIPSTEKNQEILWAKIQADFLLTVKRLF